MTTKSARDPTLALVPYVARWPARSTPGGAVAIVRSASLSVAWGHGRTSPEVGAMVRLLEALRVLGLRGHLSPSGRLLILDGRRGRAFVTEAERRSGIYVWCNRPDGRAVELHHDPVAAIRVGARRAARAVSQPGGRRMTQSVELPAGDEGRHGAPARRVLVVDGTPEILDLLRDLLKDAGYGVAATSRPEAALAEAKRLMPDVIVLEAVFGQEAAGLRLLDELGRDPATAAIPIVLCTAAVEQVRALSGDRARRLAGIVLKPFDLDDLLREVGESLSRRTTQGEDRLVGVRFAS